VGQGGGGEEIQEWKRGLTLEDIVVGDFRGGIGVSIEYHDAFVSYRGVKKKYGNGGGDLHSKS